MDATPEVRHKEMLDQILAMAMKMASDLKACNAELKSINAMFPIAPSAFVADPDSSEREVDATSGTGFNSVCGGSALAVHSAPAPPIPSPASAPPQDADLGFQSGVTELSYTHDPPFSTDGELCILFDADDGDVDNLSRLSDSLLRDIVARLPIKDAGRTAVLSRRWRPIWRAALLLVGNADLVVVHVNPNQCCPFRNFVASTDLDPAVVRHVSRRDPLSSDHRGGEIWCTPGCIVKELRMEQPVPPHLFALIRPYDPGTGFVGGVRVGVCFDTEEVQHERGKTIAMGLLRRTARTWPADLRTGVGTPLGGYDGSLDDGPASGFAHLDASLDRAVGRVGQAPAAAAVLRADAVGGGGHLQLAVLGDLMVFTSLLPTSDSYFSSAPLLRLMLEVELAKVPLQEAVFHHLRVTQLLDTLPTRCSTLSFYRAAQITVPVITCQVPDGNMLQFLLIFFPDEIEMHIKSVGSVSLDVGFCCSKKKMAWYYCLQFVLATSSACASSPASTELFGSWCGIMQLISGFLLEASPWCWRYVLFVQLRSPWPAPNSTSSYASSVCQFCNHNVTIERHCCTFGPHIQSFRPLSWPPWMFALVFSTWILWVSSLSLLRPPDMSSSSYKPCIDSRACFDPGITSTGIVMFRKEHFWEILALHKSREEFLTIGEVDMLIIPKCSTPHYQNWFFPKLKTSWPTEGVLAPKPPWLFAVKFLCFVMAYSQSHHL